MINTNRSLLLKVSVVIFLSIAISSCTAYKSVPYLLNAESIPKSELDSAATVSEFKFKVKDIITITVTSPTPEVAIDFNRPPVPSGAGSSLPNYIIDKDGEITFPVIGKLKLEGLTREEAQVKIHDLIYPKYIKENPIVNIRNLGFTVTVLGEVAKPGIYSSPGDKMSIFDALADAGDLTIYGNRKNIVLIREDNKGELSIHRINLQDRNLLLNTNIYYLQQNDKLYIEPNKSMGNNSGISSIETLALSATSVFISLLSMIILIKK